MKASITSLFYELGKKKFCARRTMGIIGFLSSIVAVFVGVNHDALQLLMIMSASLLGITTLDGMLPTAKVTDEN